jgi:hypothetical protein
MFEYKMFSAYPVLRMVSSTTVKTTNLTCPVLVKVTGHHYSVEHHHTFPLLGLVWMAVSVRRGADCGVKIL